MHYSKHMAAADMASSHIVLLSPWFSRGGTSNQIQVQMKKPDLIFGY